MSHDDMVPVIGTEDATRHYPCRQVVEHCGAAIMITDSNGTILDVNPAFTEITGYLPVEVIGRNPSIMKSMRHSPAFYGSMWEQLLATGRWEGEVWDRRRSGEEYPKWLTIRRMSGMEREGFCFVAVFADVSEMKKSQEFFRFLARHDALTRLPNRLSFAEHVKRILTGYAQDSVRLAILFLDLDGFKEINDRLGHFAGDRLLVLVGERLQGCIKESDMVARHGGDEFVVVLDGVVDRDHVEQVIMRIMLAIQSPFRITEGEVEISASMGVALYPEDGTRLEELLRRSDRAMYAAKLSGVGTYRFAGDLNP